jgi:hypothetical protein
MQLVWLMLLAVNIGAAGLWWWVSPSGSPDPLVNQVVPLIAVVVFLVALFARGRLSQVLLPPVLAAILMFWMAFGISARVLFPESFRTSWNVPFLGGAGLTALWLRQFRARARPIWLVLGLVVLAGIAGWVFPGALRAEPPATHPTGASIAAAPSGTTDHKLIKLSKDAQLRPEDGRVVIRRDKLILNVQPMLSFSDRSPDRFWISQAPEGMSFATKRALVSKVHDATRWSLYYKDEDLSVVDVATRDGAVQIDARSRLPEPIFSHVNTFAELTLQGHQKLTVSFSPLPQKRFELAPPAAPGRFAYLDEAGVFHVMQSAQRLQGPYTELGSGRMGRSDPLGLTIYDGDKAMFTVTFDDWAAQAATQLSPTAGSGIPVNAIELVRGGDAEGAPALITLSLAATAIGRGTQTVGHAAGVYRDRITVKLP